MSTAQGDRQVTVRASTQTTLTYEGDWHALFDQGGVAAGTFNERLLAWINGQLDAAYGALPDAMQAFASSQAAGDWSSMGVFTIMAKNNFTAARAPSATDDSSAGYSPGSFWLNDASAQMWICRDATAGVAAWDLLDMADHPGYVSGQWYMPLYAQPAAGGSTGGNSIRLIPFVLKSRVTLNSLGCWITTASAGGNVQLALYANNPAIGRPTGPALASTPSLSTTSTGLVSNSISGGNVTFDPGLYWQAVNADNATVVLQTQTGSVALMSSLIGGSLEGKILVTATSTALNLSVAQTFGTWPDLTSPAGGFTENPNNSSALIHFKVA